MQGFERSDLSSYVHLNFPVNRKLKEEMSDRDGIDHCDTKRLPNVKYFNRKHDNVAADIQLPPQINIPKMLLNLIPKIIALSNP